MKKIIAILLKGVRFMKRLVTLILVFIICVTFLIIPTSAETYDPYDSRYITSEEKAQLAIPNGGVTYDEEIIKLYYGMFLYSFAQQKDIMSIIETKLQLYMIVTDSVYINVMRIYEGRGDIFGGPEWMGFYTYTKYPNLVFDSSVKVDKIYCLDGLGNYDGAYIYYETDHGVYVLFTKYETYEEVYLFPLSDFYEYAKIRSASMRFDNEEDYLLSDAPHAVPHPDTNNDEKCDVCGIAIPENNDPFPHIPKTNTDKPTDNIEETNTPLDKGCGGCISSAAFSAAALAGFMGMVFAFKKKDD